MSHLPLGGGSDERTEDSAAVCFWCGWPIGYCGSDVTYAVEVNGEGVCCDADCFNDYVLASQRAMDREAVQG